MITFPLLFHYFSKKSRFEIVSVKNPFLRVSLKPTDHYGPLQNLRTTTKPTDLTLKPTDPKKLVPHTSTNHYWPLYYLPLRTWRGPKTYGPRQTCPTHHYFSIFLKMFVKKIVKKSRFGQTPKIKVIGNVKFAQLPITLKKSN